MRPYAARLNATLTRNIVLTWEGSPRNVISPTVVPHALGRARKAAERGSATGLSP